MVHYFPGVSRAVSAGEGRVSRVDSTANVVVIGINGIGADVEI